MKDIDFDELDRAVSSVLGQKTPSVPSNDEPVKQEVVASEDTSEDTASEDNHTIQQEDPVQDTTSNMSSVDAPEKQLDLSPAPATNLSSPILTGQAKPLALKRRGKIMDVTHPNSATKFLSSGQSTDQDRFKNWPAVDPSPSAQVESNSEEVESVPVMAATPTQLQSEPTAELDEARSLIGAEPEPVTIKPAVFNTEIGQQDTASGSNYNESQVGESSTSEPSLGTTLASASGSLNDASSEESDPVTPATASLADSIPPTSPFLADTKVDKRPLGGTSDSLGQYAATVEKPDTDSQNAPAVPLPRELQSDIVGIESTQEISSNTATSPFAASVAAAPEASDDERVEGHPLFDTSTYHEPIAAVPHKSLPAWLKWTLGLITCLALGAGVGYLLFAVGL